MTTKKGIVPNSRFHHRTANILLFSALRPLNRHCSLDARLITTSRMLLQLSFSTFVDKINLIIYFLGKAQSISQ